MTVRVSWYGLEVKGAVHRASGQAVREAAEFVLAQSNERVPIEEGTLMRSGATDVDEGDLRATISYDTPYAARQHEELSWRHDAGRSAKYLETALNGTRDQQAAIIARRLNAAFGGDS